MRKPTIHQLVDESAKLLRKAASEKPKWVGVAMVLQDGTITCAWSSTDNCADSENAINHLQAECLSQWWQEEPNDAG